MEGRLDLLQRMARTLTHRGPDEEGYYVDDFVGLGHRRLSIIDLESGRQPMANEDGQVRVVFNGEIYNHGELGALLRTKGHRFTTRSDTEVIVHAYEEWGADCVERLRGMFAFAVWDRRRQCLLLARDRLGKKPLYYARVGDALIFGSEIKALLEFPDLDRTLDLEAVSDYLSLLYIPREKSIFRQVRKLPPATTLVADRRGVRTRQYWDLRIAPVANEGAPAARVAELLDEAVRLRLQSDVPLGAFLSGGVDSSAVVATMARAGSSAVITASIGFTDSAFDESQHARMVARHFRTDHHEYVVTPDAVDVVQRLVWHFDEPFGDASAIPTHYVSQLARQHVTVALSGDGGDESFAGYRRYCFDVRENKLRNLIPVGLREPIFGALGTLYPKADCLPQVFRGRAFLSNIARTPWAAYLHSVSAIALADKAKLLRADVVASLGGYDTTELFAQLYHAAEGPDSLSRIQYIDFKTYLPDDILTKVDRASMANSLEVRCPLLDHHLVEYVAGLPSHLKLRGRRSKLVLKDAVRDLVPQAILDRDKMGFAMPVGNWLRGDLRPLVEEFVLSASDRHGLFERSTLERFWRQHRSGIRDRTTELWGVLVFNLWYQRFMGSPPTRKGSTTRGQEGASNS
jgi:asparagine synthase (glutamine-hydrolysing)